MLIIEREFSTYVTRFVLWDETYKLVYRKTEAGKEYIGGYDPRIPCGIYWSAIQFKEDDPKAGSLTVVQENGRIYDLPGYKPEDTPIADPLEWIIARSERQLMERWQILQQVKE
jgi:hypothetical protein